MADIPTEVTYYLRKAQVASELGVEQSILELDPSFDQYSGFSHLDWNPAGLKIEGGVGFETDATLQPSWEHRPVSGDGTVPYASLAWAHHWKILAEERRKQGLTSSNVEVTEVRGAQHRLMLNNDAVLDIVISYLCSRPETAI